MTTCRLLCIVLLLSTLSRFGSAQSSDIWVDVTSVPSFPCGSEEKPCSTLSDAVAMACNATNNPLNQSITVLVEQGNYDINSTIYIPCPVQLRSVNGENSTILSVSGASGSAIEFIHTSSALSALSGFSIHAMGNHSTLVRFNLGEDSDIEITNITFSREYRVQDVLNINTARRLAMTNLTFDDGHALFAMVLESVSVIDISGLRMVEGEYSTILQLQDYDQLNMEHVLWHNVHVSETLLLARGHLNGLNRTINYLSDIDILAPVVTIKSRTPQAMISLQGPEESHIRDIRIAMAGEDRLSQPFTWTSVFEAERRLTLENADIRDIRIGAIVSGCIGKYGLQLCDIDHHLVVRNSTFEDVNCFALFLPGGHLEVDSCIFQNISGNFILTGMGPTSIAASNITATNLQVYSFLFVPQTDSAQVNLTDITIYNVTKPDLFEGSLIYFRCYESLQCTFHAERCNFDMIEATLMGIWSSVVTISDSTFARLYPPVGGGMGLKDCNSTMDGLQFRQGHLTQCISVNGGESRLSNLAFVDNNASIALLTTTVANVTLEYFNMSGNSVDGVVGSLIWAQKGTDMTAKHLNVTNNQSVLGGGCAFTMDSRVHLSSSFFNDNRAAFGGALYMSGESISVVEDVEISNCTAASDGGGIWIGDSASVDLQNIVIFNTRAISSGGAIVVWSNATLNVSRALLQQGEALSGGGVYLGGYTISLFDQVNVTSCQAFTSGGGLANTAKANTTWSNFIMDHCNASVGSAVVSEDFSTVTMNQGTICHNYAENEAGGLLLDFNSQARMTSVAFYNNSAGSTAGAVMAALNSVAHVRDCYFSDNFSGSKGGSIGVINSAYVHMDTVLIQNSGSDSGGAIYVDDSGMLNIDNSTISNNIASSRAGGLHCAGKANVTLTDCLVCDNIATEGPGGAFVIQDSASLVLVAGNFTNNRATYGGAFFSQSSGVSLQSTDSQFNHNSAQYDGGALYFSQSSRSAIFNLTCQDNIAGYDGGCFAVVDETYLTIFNSTLTGNQATGRGGGILMGQNTTFVTNDCQISYNRAHNGGGLFVVTQNGNFTDNRSCFFGNAASFGGAAFVGGSKVSFLQTNFTSNNSTRYGGAVNLKLDITTPVCPYFGSTTFKNNSASIGGAISVIPLFNYASSETTDCSHYIFTDTLIHENSALLYGGGLFLVVKKDIKLFNGVDLSNNSAERFGGAIFFDQYFNASNLISRGNFAGNMGGFGGDNVAYGNLAAPQNAENFCNLCNYSNPLIGDGYQNDVGFATFPEKLNVTCPQGIHIGSNSLSVDVTMVDEFDTPVKGPFLDNYNDTFVNLTMYPAVIPGLSYQQMSFDHQTGIASLNLTSLCLQPLTYSFEFVLVNNYIQVPSFVCVIQVEGCPAGTALANSSDGCGICNTVSSGPVPYSVTLLVFIVIFLLCVLGSILAVLCAGYVRRKRKLAHYAALEIPDFTSKPHPKLEDILNDSTITRLRWQDVTLDRVIGKGSSGIVRNGIWKHSGVEQSVALKELILTVEDLSQADFENFLVEIKYASALINKHIVRFLGILVTPDLARVYLVTELMQQGSLRDLLTKKGPNLPLYVRVKMAKEAAKGMSFLHSKNLIHRDLKSHNLLVNENWDCKVGDFGISTVRPTVTRAMTCVGTPVYMAPEVLARNKYSEKADVYSFGIVLTEIFTDRLPYDHPPYNEMNQAQLMYNILENNCRPMLTGIDPTMQQLIEECWKADPQLRPTFPEIVGRLKRFEAEILPDGELPALPSLSYNSSPFSSSESTTFFTAKSEIELPSPPRHLTDEDPQIN